MNIENIIDSVKSYHKETNFRFYKDALDKLHKESGDITRIPEDEHLLEAVRIHLCYHEDKYYITITDNEPTNQCYRNLKLTDKQSKNLAKELLAIESDSMDTLCSDSTLTLGNNIFCIFSQSPPKKFIYQTQKIYNAASALLGIDSFRHLEHQNLHNFCKIYRDTYRKAVESVETLKKYHKRLHDLNWKDRERIMIFSGMVNNILGTTYTPDVDALLIHPEKKSYDDTKKVFKDVDFDSHILLSDGHWHKKDGTVLKYQSDWFTHILPNISGAQDINDAVANPKHHFHYMGMKFISVEMHLQRTRKRSEVGSFVDMIMLKRLNGLKIQPPPCIPNMRLHQGKVSVLAGDKLENIYMIVQKLLKVWYKTYLTINQIKKELRECTEEMEAIYRGKVPTDSDTQLIKEFHTEIKRRLILQECHSCDALLDIGSGRLRDLDFWDEVRIKRVVAIEPSKHSVRKAIGRIKRTRSKTKVSVVTGYGDEKWSGDSNYRQVLSTSPFDCITFQFTIHYMVKNMDTLFTNLSQVVKKGTKIIINMVDGEYAHQKLVEHHGRTEVRNEQEPIFGIYSLHDIKDRKAQVLVYFKGTYGVQQGSIEYLVYPDELVQKFEKHGYKLQEKKPFLEYDLEEKGKMTQIQKHVSRYYLTLLFVKL